MHSLAMLEVTPRPCLLLLLLQATVVREESLMTLR